EEASVGRELGMECQAQQPTLATGADPSADIQPGTSSRRLTGLQFDDLTGLLDDVQVTRAIARIGHEGQWREASREWCDEASVAGLSRRRRGGRRAGGRAD